MDSLPPELLRYFIPFLPLTSLIAARGVSIKWRSLALTASLHPARKVLLDIYLTVIAHPNFPSLVKALQAHLHEFDREAYVADLASRGCILPDVFEFWILEWPSNAIHFWAWPGIARWNHGCMHSYYYKDGNAMGEAPPIVNTIPVPKREVAAVGSRTCQGLLLYEVYLWSSIGVCQLWLVVDENEKINDRRAGRLVWTSSNFLPGGRYDPGPKTVFYDTPFGSSTDFKLIDFFNLLDVSYAQVDDALNGYYFDGILWTDDDVWL